ncbi:MAG: BlaI/MecI/CopY family transcriptional regulator [Bacteroidota bacterium]|nr:BlaI/MecI/CopY family transcriptional regulator [Bacteroidota bacterium]
MKELTKAEEQVMEYLWKLEKAFVKDILEQFPEPRPAYNTVSTIVRILEKKGMIGYNAYGKTHKYYPLYSKSEYKKGRFKEVVKKHFNNSYQKFASFFVREEDLSIEDLEEMKRIMESEIQKRKKHK